MDGKIIDAFETGGGKLRTAIAGLTQKDFLWVPPPGAGIGRWSIQQIVMHLMDDELIWASRMKTIIAEDNPQILGFDESKFAANLKPEEQDAQMAVEIVELNRGLFASVLRNLPEATFKRTGRHNDLGSFTLEQAVQWTTEHLEHHVLYINLKRDRLGKAIKEK
jgi:hypothetical protein